MAALQLQQSYDAAFVNLLQYLCGVYPEEVQRLEGIHSDQLDINKVSRAYFTTSERKGSATADHSIDPNANVSGRDVITYNYEVPKPLMKLNSLYNLWSTMRDMYGEDSASECIEANFNGTVYINDAWDIGRPYCFNFSAYDIALLGLPMGGRLTVDPPKSLNAFLRQVEQFVVYAANSTLGATGMADLLIVASWYVDRMLQTGRDHHVTVASLSALDNAVCEDEVWAYVYEALTSLIYTLNWEFRGNQSPFTNVSVYDRFFLESLLPGYKIQGVCPDIQTVSLIQKTFLRAYNDVLHRTPITFPVVTACFSVEPETRAIKDPFFLSNIAKANKSYGCINIYCGETSTLSSCCRLRSNINDLGYSNTLGAGSTKIGSLGVVTLNLPRLAREANKHNAPEEAFITLVRKAAATAGYINHAKRTFIEDRIQRGALPLYTQGFMDIKRQYSTCGFTGLYEAGEILRGAMNKKEFCNFGEDVLCLINTVNEECVALFKTPHNMEQVPGESSAVKLAQKDRALGMNPEGYEVYSNQFLPLWQEGADLLDRIEVQGKLDAYCTGGAVCHLNVATVIEQSEVIEALVKHAAETGVVYFAINYQINRCANGHMTVGRGDSCPICKAPIMDTYTRVVGFLTNTKHWNKTRREHDWPERKFIEHA